MSLVVISGRRRSVAARGAHRTSSTAGWFWSSAPAGAAAAGFGLNVASLYFTSDTAILVLAASFGVFSFPLYSICRGTHQ